MNSGEGKMNPSSISRLTLEAATHPLFRGHVPEDRPRFLVAYKHGIVQLMRNENDASQPFKFFSTPYLR